MSEIRLFRMIRVGISGWTYAGWRGRFYPKGLVQAKELRFAAETFPSIEINGTHYSLQTPKSFLHWAAETPEDFVFSVKGSRYITHMKRLRDIGTPLANFFASGVLALGDKLGPFLWQLPPSLRFDAATIESFLGLLPRTSRDAAGLARKHGPELSGRSYLRPGKDRPLRHCLEVRHESFLSPDFIELLRRFQVALVFADTAKKFPYAEDLTSDFVYVRLHGDEELYASGYGDHALRHWARRLRLWRQGRQPKDARLVAGRTSAIRGAKDAYVYFDNDMKVKAPGDALRLAEMLAPAHRRRSGARERERRTAG